MFSRAISSPFRSSRWFRRWLRRRDQPRQTSAPESESGTPRICPGLELPVLSQQLIDDHAAGGGDIERMLAAEHRNADVGVAARQQRLVQALGFVAEQHADREARLPIVEIGGMNAGFDGCDFRALLAQLADQGAGFRVMFPSDGFLGA